MGYRLLQIDEIPLEIIGTGEHVPSSTLASSVFDLRLGKPTGWTFEQTGVRSRAVAAPAENVLAMAASASRAALEKAEISADDLDAIISVGSVPAQAIPCTAALLQRELGLSASGIPAFDINATCIGFVVALDLMAQAIQTGRYRRVLIVASERPSIGLDPEDFATASLFGDGAGAVIVGTPRRSGAVLLGTHFQTFSEGASWCHFDGSGSDMRARRNFEGVHDDTYFKMRGKLMYRLAAERMPAFLGTLLNRSGLRIADVNVWIAHQASGHALRHMQEALDLPSDRFVHTLETFGNLVSASIPVTLHHGILTRQIKPRDIVALVGTGAGLSLAGAVIRF